jgi:hypothetical protein
VEIVLKRKLYIHVGPAKTGTSAVQAALRDHDNSVVVYPKVGLWPDGSHHNLVLNYFRDYARAEAVPDDIETLFDRIADEAGRSDRDVLVSSESLGGAGRSLAFIEALLTRVGPAFDAEILFVVRDHFARAASVYNQRVKDAATRECRDPDQFLLDQARQLRYAPAIKRFRKAGFRVSALNYHPAEDFGRRFLGHVGFAEGGMPAVPARNVSLSTKALITLLAANRAAGTHEAREMLFAALRRMPGCFAPSRAIFGREAVMAAEKEFASDREFLRARFAIELPAPQAEHDCDFRIEETEFDELASAMSELGAFGSQVREHMKAYLRPHDDSR